MPQGLPVSKIIQATVTISPTAATFANFNSMLILGDSNVINVKDRIRSYSSLTAVGADFASTLPEYLAAKDAFGQIPAPTQIYIGRWAQSATAGLLVGGVLTTAQQAIANWTSITAGGFKIAVDGGAATAVSGLNFSGATSLNGVASIIQTGIQALGGSFASVTVTWNATYGQFTIASGSTGTSSAVAALTAPASGTDISGAGLLAMTASTMQETVQGIAAETALAAVQALDALQTQWYALMVASTHAVDADHLAIAAYVESSATSGNAHIYGVTTSEAAALSSGDTTSIGYQLKQLGYRRTLTQYSSADPYAVASLLARGTTVDFNQNNSTITFMFQQEPGVTSESLTSTQAAALDANSYNYFAAFNNNTSIIVNGKTASGGYIDETWNDDWFANQIQTDIYNLLYTSGTKIPQTDAGNHLIATQIEAACLAARNNGMLAAGTWQSQGFGQLRYGDFLAKGYYVYAPPIANQAAADRSARKSVSFQVAAKFAGAIHDVVVGVTVNR